MDFVRHGLSRDLVNDVRSNPETPLVEEGRVQAGHAGQIIAVRKEPPDLILSSPLPRAFETAEIIARVIGYDIDTIKIEPGLAERNWGNYTGKQNSWIEEQIGSEAEAFDSVPGAETIEQLQERAAGVFDRILALPQAYILVVGHAQFGRALRRHIAGLPASFEYTHDTGSFENGEVVRFYPAPSSLTRG